METPASNPKPKFDVYAAMMLLSALALAIGIAFMCIELNKYGGLTTGYPWWKTPK